MGVETIIQGGAVGISVALIGLVWKVWTATSKYTEKITDVVEKNAIAMTSLCDSINANTQVTRETKDLMVKINGRSH